MRLHELSKFPDVQKSRKSLRFLSAFRAAPNEGFRSRGHSSWLTLTLHTSKPHRSQIPQARDARSSARSASLGFNCPGFTYSAIGISGFVVPPSVAPWRLPCVRAAFFISAQPKFFQQPKKVAAVDTRGARGRGQV